MKKSIVLFLLFIVTIPTFADAPVVDYSSDASSRVEVTEDVAPSLTVDRNLNIDQRVAKVERQIRYINEQKLSIKIEDLQQQIQNLTGKLETQYHQIAQLNTQLKDFYQDLDRRLGNNKTTDVSKPAVTTPVVQDGNIIPATSGNVESVFSSATKKKSDAPSSDEAFLKEQQLYQTAIDLLPDKKYSASETKLREYINRYPKGVYVADSHYWLGEINFLQKNFDAAEEEFRIVIDKYKKSNRVTNAMLKLSLVHQNQGREGQAKKELNEIVKKYPKSSAAQIAKKQLADI